MEYSAKMSGKLCAVIIPMYNESECAKNSVLTILAEINKLNDVCDLVIVEDGSNDKTYEILNELNKNNKFKLIRHSENHGYGSACKTGAHYAYTKSYNYALFMDSDLTNDPRDIIHFVKYMKDDCDVIKATRYHPNGGVVGVPIMRRIISTFGNHLLRIIVTNKVTDITNGFRAVKLKLFVEVDCKERGFSVIVEEFCSIFTKDLKIANVPVILGNRSVEQRATSFNYNIPMFWKYLKYPIFYRIKYMIGI